MKRDVDNVCIGIPYISKLRRGKDKLESLDDMQENNKEVLKEHQKMSREEISKVMRLALQRYLVDLIRAVVCMHPSLSVGPTDTCFRCSAQNQIGFVASSNCPPSQSHWPHAVDSRAKLGS